jgi:hypothetical protein
LETLGEIDAGRYIIRIQYILLAFGLRWLNVVNNPILITLMSFRGLVIEVNEIVVDGGILR